MKSKNRYAVIGYMALLWCASGCKSLNCGCPMAATQNTVPTTGQYLKSDSGQQLDEKCGGLTVSSDEFHHHYHRKTHTE